MKLGKDHEEILERILAENPDIEAAMMEDNFKEILQPYAEEHGQMYLD
jgi:hypothetical protein